MKHFNKYLINKFHSYLGWIILILSIFSTTAYADLQNPNWFDANWHYRVAINIPVAAKTNSTIKFDVDFNALIAQMGISGSFDNNSPRIVRANGSLATEQEFTDSIYGAVLDANSNARGESKFILEDNGAITYYLYFDILENGAKPINPQSTINGNFEHSSGTTPTNWTQVNTNTGGDQRNEVHSTLAGNTINLAAQCGDNGSAGIDNSPNSNGGEKWHLLGYREACEDGAGSELVIIERDIDIPASNKGNLDFYFQYQGFDTFNGSNNYDWFYLEVGGGIVDHADPAPSLGIANASGNLLITTIGIGKGVGSYSAYADGGWEKASLDLSGYTGTVTIRFVKKSFSDNTARSWIKIDDVEWSVQSATLGIAEGFGVNTTKPNDTSVAAISNYSVNDNMFISAVVDADLNGVNPVTANIYDPASTLVKANIRLYNDASHGDAVAGDNTWTNDGSDVANSTYTFLASDSSGNWNIKVFAKDASTSTIGAQNGLVHINGQAVAELQTNFHNIDEQDFILNHSIDLSITKTADITGPEINDIVIYTITVTNSGSSTAASVSVGDTLDAKLLFVETIGCTEDPNGEPSCTLGTINAGATKSYTIEASVIDGGAPGANDDLGNTIPNTAEVITATPADVDSTVNNHIASEDDQTNLDIIISGLKLTKFVCNLDEHAGTCNYPGDYSDSASGNPGDELKYRINYERFGIAIFDTIISDSIPTNTSLKQNTFAGSTELELVCPDTTTSYVETGAVATINLDLANECSLTNALRPDGVTMDEALLNGDSGHFIFIVTID